MMDTKEAIYERHSTRWFTEQSLSLETVRQIVLDAGQAPSWRNSQPWRVYIAHGQALDRIKLDHLAAAQGRQRGRSELGWAYDNMWDQQSQTNQSGWDHQVYDLLGNDIGTFGQAQARLFNAQAAIYFTLFKGSSAWSMLDLGAFTQTLLLGATARGVQSIHAYELVKYPAIVRAHAPIGDDQLLVSGIALGFEDTTAKINKLRPGRAMSEQVVEL
ncbi:nitroreductase [Pectobacterium aroidearum]|uniref:nitroreductase n=1 Tax=Pectobacterium aroidearum TaxID=1201031 RepID=UPI0032EC9C97